MLQMTQNEATARLAEAARQLKLDLAADGSVAHVNKVLRQAGFVEKLWAGRGYYYWSGGADGDVWDSTYVYRASHMTLRRWIEEVAYNVGQHGRAATL